MTFRTDAQAMIEELARYAEAPTDGAPVVRLTPADEIARDLELDDLVRRGGLAGERLTHFARAYLATTIRLAHPGSLAHQVAVPHPSGAIGALLGAFTNNPMAIYEMGPGAATIELFVLNWLLEKVGWTPAPLRGPAAGTGGGVLTHGGSLANLTALIAARTRVAGDVWRDGTPDDLVLLAPPLAHYSIARAAGILGLGRRRTVSLPALPDGTVDVARVPAVLDAVFEAGKRPLALVANACSTAVGRYDPLRELGALCRERGVWLHVDGAHGASALLSRRHRHLLDGVALADSLVWDAHKLLRTPGLCTALLVRDVSTLEGAFEQEASYLFHERDQPGTDLLGRTIECTKAGLGLRLFAVLGAMGEEELEAYVDERLARTAEIHEYLARQADVTCPVAPQSNILCFRLAGSDALQLAVRDALLAEGTFHLSTTMFEGLRYLRLVVTSPATELRHAVDLLHAARAAAARLSTVDGVEPSATLERGEV